MREATADENALDLDELERLAKEAKPQSRWLQYAYDAVRSKVHDGEAVIAITEPYGDDPAGYQAMHNAAFIAAADPKTVLSLIAALRAKETETRAERAEPSALADCVVVSNAVPQGEVYMVPAGARYHLASGVGVAFVDEHGRALNPLLFGRIVGLETPHDARSTAQPSEKE